MKHFLLCTLIFLAAFCSHPLTSQTWQWASRGGGTFNGNNVYPYEAVIDLATDSKGNLYMLSMVESSAFPTIGDTILSGYGARDILLSSHNCNGVLRWKKMIGSYDTDHPTALVVDHSDHIYIAGQILAQSPAQTHFDTDTVLPASNQKSMFIARYDTTGHLNWMRQPQPDTASLLTGWLAKPYELVVDAMNNVYVLSYLNQGLIAGGGNFVINTAGIYILKYGPTGTLLQVLQPPLNWLNGYSGGSTTISIRMILDQNNNFIASGNVDYGSGAANSFSIGGIVQPTGSFVCSFTQSGTLNWRFRSDSAGFSNRPVMDANGDLYFCGGGIHGAVYNGYTVVNSVSTLSYIVPLIMKTNAAGTLIWARNAGTNAGTGFEGITLRGQEVVAVGEYPGKVFWGSQSLSNPPNEGYDIFTARFDKTTGALLAIDSVKSNFGSNDYASGITSDKKGNLFISGRVGSMLTFGTLSPIYNSGGDYDFFFAKYGYGCNCNAPVPNFSMAYSGNIVNLQYTGTTPVDSVRWDFSDGTSASGLNASHAFSGNGTYTICASAYGSCGLRDTCMHTPLILSVGSMMEQAGIRIYPNPAQDDITIEGHNMQRISLMNTTGQVVLEQHITGESPYRLDLRRYPKGVYLLKISDDMGNTNTSKLVIDR